MAAPSEGFSKRRGWFSLHELLPSWWRHRVSFLLSLSITLVALSISYLAFLQEKRTPLSELAERLELDTLDTRNPEEWDLYSSLDLVAARALLGQEAQDTNLFYGPTGIWKISLGTKAAIFPGVVRSFSLPARTSKLDGPLDVPCAKIGASNGGDLQPAGPSTFLQRVFAGIGPFFSRCT